jgi:hypothetical protein
MTISRAASAAMGLASAWVLIATTAGHAQTAAPVPKANSLPAPAQAATVTQLWGAIAFTADGSYSTVWKSASNRLLKLTLR